MVFNRWKQNSPLPPMETLWKISNLGGSEDEDVDVPKLEELLTQDSGGK